MVERKCLVFDMDGTLADFYGVEGWLEAIRSENTTPYEVAIPLLEMARLNALLNTLKIFGWEVIITSWLAKDSTREFDNAVREAKREWLRKYNFPADNLHLVKYGTTKADCTRKIGGIQVLFDDNEKVRKGWDNPNKRRYAVNEKSIIEALEKIIEMEKQF